jgi:hypothetical protein
LNGRRLADTGWAKTLVVEGGKKLKIRLVERMIFCMRSEGRFIAIYLAGVKY